ncbi:MAG: zinc-ribbon domain-containing protein [bacterium]|nr:zinc-ribbon domain-containing protein [bacterium]
MIIQCEGCAAKYFLPKDKIPADPMKVRCPQCRAVFQLVTQPAEPVPAAVTPSIDPAPAAAPQAAEATPAADVFENSPLDTSPQAAEPTVAEAKPAPKRKKLSKTERADARAQRLARVLVSDIVMYNKEKRDQALIDGRLMAVLSDEIKKSWELYKEKVGEELAKSTNYFKDALNEILADGQQVF